MSSWGRARPTFRGTSLESCQYLPGATTSTWIAGSGARRLEGRLSIDRSPPNAGPGDLAASRPSSSGLQGSRTVRRPTRTAGEAFEWHVQLSRTRRAQLGWTSPDARHLNVSLKGEITH
ncbi:polymorphic toxin type 17 domain-containing protein [Sorangium sp. So ce1128]